MSVDYHGSLIRKTQIYGFPGPKDVLPLREVNHEKHLVYGERALDVAKALSKAKRKQTNNNSDT